MRSAARRRRPGRLVKADVVGSGHLRLIAAGDDGRRLKAIAFRMADSALGEALLAGRLKRDEYNGHPTAELHLEDAAWA
jgi:single-stranded-DNA-specific exonuclease